MESSEIVAGRYAGRSVLITGGANGLGFASAERLGREGAALGIMDLDEAAIERSVARLREQGIEAHGYLADRREDY